MRANGNLLLAPLLLSRVAGVYCGGPSNTFGAQGMKAFGSGAHAWITRQAIIGNDETASVFRRHDRAR
jgi:nicotinic acid phosphoribosyltransferase